MNIKMMSLEMAKTRTEKVVKNLKDSLIETHQHCGRYGRGTSDYATRRVAPKFFIISSPILFKFPFEENRKF